MLEFEKAGVLRDQIIELRKVMEGDPLEAMTRVVALDGARAEGRGARGEGTGGRGARRPARPVAGVASLVAGGRATAEAPAAVRR